MTGLVPAILKLDHTAAGRRIGLLTSNGVLDSGDISKMGSVRDGEATHSMSMAPLL